MNKIIISLSATEKELWETEVRLNVNFDRIEETPKGVLIAKDSAGKILDIYVPSLTKLPKEVTTDNMKEAEQIIGTPDGEVAVVEQSPVNTTIVRDQTGEGLV